MSSPLLVNNSGATMVEAALALGILFAFVAAVIDFGLGFQRYSLLNHATTEFARGYALELGRRSPPFNCAQFHRDAEDAARLVAAPLRISPAPTFQTSLIRDTSPPMASSGTFTVVGASEFRCLFCQLIPRGFTISATSKAPVQNLQLLNDCADVPLG